MAPFTDLRPPQPQAGGLAVGGLEALEASGGWLDRGPFHLVSPGAGREARFWLRTQAGLSGCCCMGGQRSPVSQDMPKIPGRDKSSNSSPPG